MNVSDHAAGQPVAPYHAIAAGYDLIMSHVAYNDWAHFTDLILQNYHPNPRRILELGCGTGSFALELQPMGGYDYVASDISPAMIEVAKRKAAMELGQVDFIVQDFTQFEVEQPFDIVVLLYDGINYLLEKDQLASLFSCVFKALKPGGIFFFDQSTPANSINNEAYFEDEGEQDGFIYKRGSAYNRETRLHKTSFEVRVRDDVFFEEHFQRAYTYEDVVAHIRNAGFKIEDAFDGFSTDPIHAESERIHWIIRRPRKHQENFGN